MVSLYHLQSTVFQKKPDGLYPMPILSKLHVKQRPRVETIIVAIIFCIGMLCSLQNRFLALFLTAALACFAAFRVLSGRTSLSIVHIPLAALPFLYLLSAVVNGLTYYAIGQAMLMCIPLLASLCLPNTKSALPIIVAGALFLAIASLFGAIVPFIPNTFTPAGFHSDPRSRLQTLLTYANTGGLLFACGIFALLGMKPGRQAHMLVKYLAVVLLAVCVFLTGSRFVLAQMLMLFIIYTFIRYKTKKIAFLTVGVLSTTVPLILVFRPEFLINSSLALRLIYWSDTIRAVAANPILGLGPEGFIFRIHELQSAIYVVRYIHSAFLQVAIDAGIPALIALCTISVMALRHTWKESRTMFFILLFLLAHSAIDANFSFFPALMLFGMCATRPTTATHKSGIKALACLALLLVFTASIYLFIGESFYSRGLRADREGRFGDARQAFQTSLAWMPGDFRSTMRLAWVHILEHEQEQAIVLLLDSHPINFNRAVRSELLVIAYKNLGMYPEWGAETLSLLEYAPLRQVAYIERSEYLIAAHFSLLISTETYETKFAALLARLETANQSVHPLARFLLERDRALDVGSLLTLDQFLIPE